MIEIKARNPSGVFAPVGPYAHAVEATSAARMLFISGTLGIRRDGTIPETVEEQLDVLWDNIRAILSDADMDVRNLVKVIAFLKDASYRAANTAARTKALGDHKVAATVVVAELLDPL
ncbi:RidA family protein [Chelatococcus sp. SYSU_G07232]|uniref:RidA family protein n=1 Tax=Chelatococcus albus TaxID=3047466 RepID=A0ABT7AF48_9HYPH|nr:RidA family protein [Chelatococcus sp. SYSU_G07232]MDJ1157994.1 RidA family protein [Chelatococcus sp. SYSU_G07232]